MAAYSFSRTPRTVPHVSTVHRTIKTAIPAPGTEALLKRLDAVEARSMHGQLPIVWDRAYGHNVLDRSANKWIDFTSGIFVANVGHNNLQVANAILSMLQKNSLHSYTYVTEKRAEYLEALTQWSGFEKAFLLSAGTEATEAALKLMRLHGRKMGKRRTGIVCIEGNWHGRTMGAQMMSSNADQKAWIGALDPYIHHVPFPYPWANEAFAAHIALLAEQGIDPTRDICGFMLESFQGWNAMFYAPAYVQSIANFCKQHNILLCFDEMQSGFARTGTKFGFEHYGVKPDLICVGKGMGSGVPLSGVLGSSAVMDLPDVGTMSSTHSANPLCCSAGLATIQEIERLNLVSEAERKGIILSEHFQGFLSRFKSISYVSGNGLIAAVVFTQAAGAAFASRVAERCMEKGLLVVHTGRESIKIGPPLIIPDDALIEGITVLDDAISEIESEKS